MIFFEYFVVVASCLGFWVCGLGVWIGVCYMVRRSVDLVLDVFSCQVDVGCCVCELRLTCFLFSFGCYCVQFGGRLDTVCCSVFAEVWYLAGICAFLVLIG